MLVYHGETYNQRYRRKTCACKDRKALVNVVKTREKLKPSSLRTSESQDRNLPEAREARAGRQARQNMRRFSSAGNLNPVASAVKTLWLPNARNGATVGKRGKICGNRQTRPSVGGVCSSRKKKTEISAFPLGLD